MSAQTGTERPVFGAERAAPRMDRSSALPWWKECVAYQVYPRSFQDSDGDGVGDIPGIISRLPYLASLGIGVIWLCPMYESPNDDNGYDISDYRSVAAEFGTLGDLERLITEARKLGIRVILDLVVNHTSDEHPWFIESRASRSSAKRDWYIWKPGRAALAAAAGGTAAAPEGGLPPTDWPSIFEGPAWEYDAATGEYYLHTFSRKQPDLNWENPAVRDAICDMIDWWAERGIAGFRVDAITFIKKRPDWPIAIDKPPHVPCNEPGVLDLLAELRDRAMAPHGLMTVAEAPNVSPEALDPYIGEGRGVFSMIFTFDHVDIDMRKGRRWHRDPWTRAEWKRAMTKWQRAAGESGWLGIYLENHDQVRSVTKFGDDGRYRAESAKCLATWYFLMRGTPFIYQGQELGMPNCDFSGPDEFRDVASRNIWREARAAGMPDREVMEYLCARSRDNSRTPMQWDSSPNAGFSAGTPWIRMNQSWEAVNVAAQDNDPASVLNHYRALARLRAAEPALVRGSFDELWNDSDEIGGYIRTLGSSRVLVACNFTGTAMRLAGPEDARQVAGRVLLDSAGLLAPGAEFTGEELAPWQAVVVAR